MSKNNKVIIASVGVLVALILAVLLVRNPAQPQTAPVVPKKEVSTPIPVPTLTPKKEVSDTHKKVAAIIDDTSAMAVKSAPGIWAKVTQFWDWLMAFDTKHAIILIAVLVFVVGFLINGDRNRKSQKG